MCSLYGRIEVVPLVAFGVHFEGSLCFFPQGRFVPEVDTLPFDGGITQAVQVVSQIDLFCSLDVHKEIVFSEYFDYFFFCPQLLKLCGLYNHFTKLLIYSPPE